MTQPLQFESRVGKDGVLTLRVPLSPGDAEQDVIVTIQPKPRQDATSLGNSGWPPRYFEQTYGSLADDPLPIPEDPIPTPESME